MIDDREAMTAELALWGLYAWSFSAGEFAADRHPRMLSSGKSRRIRGRDAFETILIAIF
jgi:hypothetical protein